ncbi:YscQ/HrcQ family type III secretion apparatus protein [Thiothrix subterranea]|uniref:YscQ/HrcQ family type III secretion apparatus protein n=1 Tax=Thiothrix subterranea TaxID=2735563 RepID=UPI00280B6AA8|nr:YscQ/HrcQ family type III secretion apparatus protein [Thiothrix subterranea]
MRNRQILFTPIKFPTQAALAMRLNNILLNKSTGMHVPVDNKRVAHCRIQPGESDTQHLCPISMTLELGGTTAGLWLSAWPLAERIKQFLPDGLLHELPENLAISIIESALAPLLHQAETGLGLQLTLQSMSADPLSTQYTMPLGFTIQILKQENSPVLQEVFGVLMLDPHLYLHLQERLRHWPSDTNLDWEEHYTPLWLEISHIVFSMQEINELQPSDLILLEDTRFEDEGLLRLCLDSGYCCEATLSETTPATLTITTEWMPMSDNEQKQNIEHISQIPVQLSFDVGKKRCHSTKCGNYAPAIFSNWGNPCQKSSRYVHSIG